MNNKQLYITLTVFRSGMSELRVLGAPIASNENEAKSIAIESAIAEHGSYLSAWNVVGDAHSIRRDLLEQAAREVLGWKPPE